MAYLSNEAFTDENNMAEWMGLRSIYPARLQMTALANYQTWRASGRISTSTSREDVADAVLPMSAVLLRFSST